MPVDFLTAEQQRRYGRYAGEPTPAQLGRYFHLDDADRNLITPRRGDHNRLGFAVQLGTVRFLGTFLADLTDVPPGVVAYIAKQLGITDTEGLRRYAVGEMRRDHTAEIRRHYGYRDFHDGTEAAALTCWLANRAWISAERPSVLFDLATARLVERKILLPGVTVLARLVAQVRDKAASRLWRTLARSLHLRQVTRLEALLVADEHTRQSPLERLRRAPTRVSVAGLIGGLKRLQERDYFTVISRCSLGKLSTTRSLNRTSCGTWFAWSWSPIGPALIRSGWGSRQSTTATPLTATCTRLPRARISRSFQSCCLPTFLAGPGSTGSKFRPNRSYMPQPEGNITRCPA
jgi:Domain of unknown function (DUF4158)